MNHAGQVKIVGASCIYVIRLPTARQVELYDLFLTLRLFELKLRYAGFRE